MKRFDDSPHAPAKQHWHARLSLGIARAGDASRLMERNHQGPLRVQKPLYPEGNAVCHTIIVHPPGGVVGGDQLAINAVIAEGAHALLATPGAGKWYKSNGHESRQQVTLEVGRGATLEWLPQETIFFDRARVQLEHAVTLAEDAAYIGMEILCFGRSASGETFGEGRVTQATSIRRGGKLVWFEQGAIDAATPAMRSPLGLAGNTVCATLIAAGKPLAPALVAALRALAPGEIGVTQMKTLVVVRHLGNSSQSARRLMLEAWRLLRPAIAGREAVVPRIWNT
ncbi:urease accessory protein UreD [Noviherbaspirillum galbum]|uniref:Urease accessory protein UreD n=1 Tax=Noviherbaspirillum galbum TaxID=2709383 RepID=A0A6B3SU40_9BURK|nr:urease accessory protein UreD [Noviherbaspirillum galbum]NEX61149.1 urease accessory protein UreD [Noviherbaspirillum galbum]